MSCRTRFCATPSKSWRQRGEGPSLADALAHQHMRGGRHASPTRPALPGSASDNAQNSTPASPRRPPRGPHVPPMRTSHVVPSRLRASPRAASEKANKNGGTGGGLRRELTRTPPGEQAYLGSSAGIDGPDSRPAQCAPQVSSGSRIATPHDVKHHHRSV